MNNEEKTNLAENEEEKRNNEDYINQFKQALAFKNIPKLRELAPLIDINMKLKFTNTFLHNIVQNSNNRDIIEILIELGCDIEAKNVHGMTPLFYAIGSNNINNVEVLIENHCDIHVEDKWGTTPFNLACVEGNIDVVLLLINNSVNIDQCNKNNTTALHRACEYGRSEVVKCLIQHHADHSIVKMNGETCLSLAQDRDWADERSEEYDEIIELLTTLT